MSSPIAIIAGAGRFPLHVAKEARRQGQPAIAIGIQGWADPGLSSWVDAYEEVPVGQLGRLIERLAARGVRRAVMAGKVTKAVLFDQRTAFDADALAVLGQVGEYSVGALLGAIARRLSSEGITLLDSSTFLKDSLCPVGVLTVRTPEATERLDLDIGMRAARALAAFDIGQTVVVKGQVVVAVEALEGTDAAIRRAHALAGNQLVVVKVAAADQDRRFDLPVIGMQTIEVLAESEVSCLAVEARATLLLDREALLGQADARGIAVIGVLPDDPAPRAGSPQAGLDDHR